MAVVRIKCPRTGRPIPTGMEMDRSAFYSMPVFFSRTLCPICKVHHEWFAMDAWLCEEQPEGGKERGTPLNIA
jgi:hypothetical protein